MSYQFLLRDSDLQHTLHRISAGELDCAIAHCEQHSLSPKAVHDIRKRIKKLQGLLRLVKTGLPDDGNALSALAKVGRGLSTQRENVVRIETFDSLFPEVPSELVAFRDQLASTLSAPDANHDPATLQPPLIALRKTFLRFRLHGKDAAILRAGLSRTQKRARAALADAIAHPTQDALHLWRKRAKDHWYQARVFCPVWPVVIEPLAIATGTLTEDLGRHHDLGQLSGFARDAVLPGSARRALATRIETDMRQIQDRIFPLGRRLFAGDPAANASLWVEWWRIWRS